MVPRAEGHSTGGQAQVRGGIVLDVTGLAGVYGIEDDRVVVGAGTRWSEVVSASLAVGRTPPVLTDYLDLSVGGTLSVGGLGGATHRHGAQTDNVLELDVVTPDGRHVTCSPATALFDAVRAGRGRAGTILRATLRLAPARPHAVTYRLRYDSLADLVADQLLVMAEKRFDHLEGQAKPDGDRWTYCLDGTRYATDTQPDPAVLHGLRHHAEEITTIPYADFLDRMADDVALLRTLGPWQHPHPWTNVLLPAHATADVVSQALNRLRPDDIGDTGVILLYPFPRAQVTTPRLHLPTATTAFLFAVLTTAPPDNPRALHEMLEDNQQLQHSAVAAGGAVYLGNIPGGGLSARTT